VKLRTAISIAFLLSAVVSFFIGRWSERRWPSVSFDSKACEWNGIAPDKELTPVQIDTMKVCFTVRQSEEMLELMKAKPATQK
jgi:hypothetical protein